MTVRLLPGFVARVRPAHSTILGTARMSITSDTTVPGVRDHVGRGLLWLDLLLLVPAAAVLRLAFFRGGLGTDEVVYLAQAHRLLQGDPGRSTYVGAIRYGINAFDALSVWLFGPGPAGADGLFFACSLAEVVLAYSFANCLWDRRAAVWSGIAVAVLPLDVLLATSYNPDCYLALVIAGSVVTFYFAERSNRWTLYLASGLLAGWVFWIKESVVIFGLVFVLLALRPGRWRSGYIWFAGGGLLMLAANLLFFWQIYGDPFYVFNVVRGMVETVFVKQDTADTSLGTYFTWLFVKIYHVGLLGWLGAAAAVLAAKRRDAGAHFVLIWGVGLLALFTVLPISLSPLKFIAKQTNYMEIFLLPFALLAGWFLARQQRRVAILLGGTMVLAGILLSAAGQQTVQIATADARAAAAFAESQPELPVFGSASVVRQSMLQHVLRGAPGRQGLIGLESGLADLPITSGPAGQIVAYVVDDPQMRYLGHWSSYYSKDDLPPAVRACLIADRTLAPAEFGLGRTVVGWARSVARLLPQTLAVPLLHATDPLWQVAPAQVYAVTRSCRAQL